MGQRTRTRNFGCRLRHALARDALRRALAVGPRRRRGGFQARLRAHARYDGRGLCQGLHLDDRRQHRVDPRIQLPGGRPEPQLGPALHARRRQHDDGRTRHPDTGDGRVVRTSNGRIPRLDAVAQHDDRNHRYASLQAARAPFPRFGALQRLRLEGTHARALCKRQGRLCGL